MVYFPLLAASVCLVVAQVYARMTTQRRWREWLTHHLLDRWLINGRYYQLHLVQGDHKNPEYRIADDVRLATDSPVDFATGVTTAVLSAATFIAVLWTIGGSLSFSLAGIEITIPGFLVVAAVAYAVLASGSMVFIGHRFVTVSENKNQSEAEFRYVLTRLSENGESIAVLGGEDEERNAVDTVVDATCCAAGATSAFKRCAPRSSRRPAATSRRFCRSSCARRNSSTASMTLGEVMQAASAFTIVQAAFNWLVDNYPRLADWTASARPRVLADGLARQSGACRERRWYRPDRARRGQPRARRCA